METDFFKIPKEDQNTTKDQMGFRELNLVGKWRALEVKPVSLTQLSGPRNPMCNYYKFFLAKQKDKPPSNLGVNS